MEGIESITPAPRTALKAGIAAMFLGCALLATLSACNTTEGVGEDLQSAGESIEDAADDAND